MLRVAITGPESSGKTSLAESLAAHFAGALVPEYAREYLTGLGRAYTRDDLDVIAKRQLSLEAEAVEASEDGLVIFDTDVFVLKIWYEFKYKTLPEYLDVALSQDRYDLHLLMRPDIPYEQDPLRENPDKGDHLFAVFERELTSRTRPYVIVEGLGEARVERAIAVVEERL